MCGAFTFGQYTRIVKELGLEAGKEFLDDRFNIRPTNYVPTVFNNAPETIQLAHWGMTPNWKNSKISLLFNTREESIIEKPYFHNLFTKHRCIILADGFYEWQKKGKEKLPYRFILKDNEPFAFAGVWAPSPKNKEPQVSIITTEPNSLVEKVHNRMPVILSLDHALDWVQNTDEAKLVRMMKPFNPKHMESYRVSKEVNVASNQGDGLINSI